tara:strand:- start:123 stop:506 length:384 start_codon:yes stop_codon:yes gene_type:complete
MTGNESNQNDLINELGRQVTAIGSKAVKLPRRLDESLEKLEQGDLQLQIRMGESDRRLRRISNSQIITSQSVLLGSLSISAAILASGQQPILAYIPLIISFPIGIGWIKSQLKLAKDNRFEKIPKRK